MISLPYDTFNMAGLIITTTPILIDYSETSTNGVLARVPVITNKGNHHCFRWTIQNIEPKSSGRSDFKSPIFTVPNKNGCKWYLSTQFQYDETRTNFLSSLQLVLDRMSDCKEAVAKFKLSIMSLGGVETHQCDLQHGRTFKFSTNFESQAGVLFSIPTYQFLRRSNGIPDVYSATIVCEIIIETTFGEDNSLSNDFGSLLKNQLFTDIVISVGEKKYPAHKVILAGRSSVFAAMFAHDTIEKKGLVRVKDMDENVVEEMLRYIYTGKVEKLENLAQDLLIAADKYCLEGLRILCENELAANLSGSNALDLLVFAKRYNSEGLKSQVVDFILSRRTKVEKTEA
ncbi:BTB and MATH domain-containing protein 41 [Sarracenia purpurea var. burkii]